MYIHNKVAGSMIVCVLVELIVCVLVGYVLCHQ